MNNPLTLLAVGFLLTTVLGGIIGSYFQRSAWNHQHRVQQQDAETTQALKTFEEISRMLDRRLHRMRVLHAAISASQRGEGESAEWLASARTDYRTVLVEWNENLNRLLALTEVSFGKSTRETVEGLYEQYSALGRGLDLMLRLQLRKDATPIGSIDFGRRANVIGDAIYLLNVIMLSLVRGDGVRGKAKGEVPSNANETIERKETIALGDHGPIVARLQRALCNHGFDLDDDGIFGLATYRAVCRFQVAKNQRSDGVVGRKTWEELDTVNRTRTTSAATTPSGAD